MRRVVLVSMFALLRPGHAGERAEYTGFWKKDCSDSFGMQIKPVAGGRYSVTFCGPGGCAEPEDTTIEGDSNYEVVSPRELKILGDTFVKCTDDPTWIVEEPASSGEQDLPDCSLGSPSKEEGVLLAWVTTVRKTTPFVPPGSRSHTTTVEPFRPLAVLQDSSLKPSSGAGIHKGQRFWRVLAPSATPVTLRSASSFFDPINDGCVFFGALGKDVPPRWTLLSSKPLPGVFRPPRKVDKLRFSQLNNSCVQQGDYPEDRAPACERPRLLAITDINKNGRPEYWATAPYLWDTGLTVWEEEDGKLTPLLELCAGCSD